MLVDEKEPFYEVVSISQFNPFQWCVVATMYTFLAFLVGFLIYISCTWNKVRINEYT